MAQFILRRFAYALLLLFFASVLIFYGLRVAPGDIVTAIASPTRRVSHPDQPQQAARARQAAAGPVLRLHAATCSRATPASRWSTARRSPRSSASRARKTLALGLSAAILTYTLAIPLGVLAAWRRNRLFDQGARFFVVLGDGHPELLPGGAPDPVLRGPAAAGCRWPARAGSSTWSCRRSCCASRRSRSTCGWCARRCWRSCRCDYIRTLRAKGLEERRIVWVHAFRNALTPVVALAGVILPTCSATR